jgi:hypothetical protein
MAGVLRFLARAARAHLGDSRHDALQLRGERVHEAVGHRLHAVTEPNAARAVSTNEETSMTWTWTWAARVTLISGLCVVAPTPAFAQFWEIVKWINEMSGPKMQGSVFEMPVLCYYESDDTSVRETRRILICPPIPTNEAGVRQTALHRRTSFGVRAGLLNNFKVLDGEQSVRDVSAWILSPPFANVRLSFDAVDIAAALDFVRFQGADVQAFWVPTTHASLTVKPLVFLDDTSKWRRLVSVGVGYTQLYAKFDSTRFGPGWNFESNYEPLFSFVIGIDGSTLLR